MRREDIAIDLPCSADWDTMTAAGKKKFCGDCKKFVHDLSRLNEDDAKALLETGKLDATVMEAFLLDQILKHVPIVTYVGLSLGAMLGIVYLAKRYREALLLACVACAYGISPYLGQLSHRFF